MASTVASAREAVADGVETVATVEDFDSFIASLDTDAYDYELVDGVIVLQSNPTGAHQQIVGNIGARLKLHMDARGCNTYLGGMRVQRTRRRTATDKPRPDIVAHCSAVPEGNFITDPVVVIEVLSPSTMDLDRGPKLKFYKSLMTVLYVALVYQDQMRVEVDRRTPEGWEREILTARDDDLVFEAVRFQLDLATVYYGTDLLKAGTAA